MLIVAVYVIFTLIAGPLYMRGRKPFNLKKMIIVFDVFLVIFNLVLLLLGA